MADIKIAAVTRAGIYSPNHIGNDTAILNLVAEQLRKRGCEVTVYNEESLVAGRVNEDIIVNMCREPESIAELQKREDLGAIVINSGYGIENCIRERMSRILAGNDIPYPQTITVNTDEGVKEKLTALKFGRCWVKRADCHTKHKEDISFVRHAEEAQEVLQEYFLRGIKRATVSRHIAGDLVKFYGVTGTDFFYSFYPMRSEQGKYGLESVKQAKGKTPPDNRLRLMCEKAAETLDIRIYGGDVIVGTDGDMKIIDFKDWPSFAPCRNEAAPHIAKAIMSVIKQNHRR